MRLSVGWFFLLSAVLLGWGAHARAQVANPFGAAAVSDGIAVSGTGEVAARPNMVEIDLNVTGRAELTTDALVKHRDSKKRVTEALTRLGLSELSIEERSLSINPASSPEMQQRIINGMPQQAGKQQIEVTSTLRVQLKNVRETPPEELAKIVGRLIDTAQDSGVSMGLSAADIQMRRNYGIYSNQNPTSVRFVVADLASLREQAYEKAVVDARQRAQRLAKLNQVKLGDAVAVQELAVAGEQAGQSSINVSFYQINTQQNPETNEEPRISSSALSTIPVQVKLLVRFAIGPAGTTTAQK